jgi:hypothetical protein
MKECYVMYYSILHFSVLYTLDIEIVLYIPKAPDMSKLI